ncbi:MAG: hypothetical protein AAGN35_17090 [Bacteroidota bacterium]
MNRYTFFDKLERLDFPAGDANRTAPEYYRALLHHLLRHGHRPPSYQDFYDFLQAGFAGPVPEAAALEDDWQAQRSRLRADAVEAGTYLRELLTWEKEHGAQKRQEQRESMGMTTNPANIEPLQAIDAYCRLLADAGGDGAEAGETQADAQHLTTEWDLVVDIFYYGREYE